VEKSHAECLQAQKARSLLRLLLGRLGKHLVRGAPEDQHLQHQRAVEETSDAKAKKLRKVASFL
jgi:hypothetical protein